MDTNLRVNWRLPVTWEISNHIVVITISGEAGDLRTAVIAAMASPLFPQRPCVLIDARPKTENPNPDQLRKRAEWIALLLSHRADSRCAVVVGPRPHQYGLARMFSVFLGTQGVQAEIFTDIDEANQWLTPADGRKVGGATGGS